MLYLTLFFESICFPTIVALGMKGLGRHSKQGAGLIIAGKSPCLLRNLNVSHFCPGVVGGAVVPPIMGAVGDAQGMGTAMAIPLIFFFLTWTYAVAVNFIPYYMRVTDAFTETEVGIKPTTGEAMKGDVSEKGGKGEVEMVEDKA